MDRAPLLVFSPLPWDSPFQRPHHVMTRLATRREVLFVEEPVYREGRPDFDIQPVAPGIRVLKSSVGIAGPAFGPAQQRALMNGFRDILARNGWSEFVAWLYNPMAVRVARSLAPRRIIYDCVAGIAAPKPVATADSAERERELLAHADVVITESQSLLKSKQHPRCVLCLPSSIDESHFARAKRSKDAPDQESLPKPRLGYLGVIDDRLDFGILDSIAAERPEWQIILVGPVTASSPATLPQRPNLHYLGPRPYAELPNYLAGWNACLMPFVAGQGNGIDSARVLEYLAADRPVVGTPVPDLAENYSEIAYLGDGAGGFLEACEHALGSSATERRARRAMAKRALARTSWDETAASMDQILTGLLGRAAKLFSPTLPTSQGAIA